MKPQRKWIYILIGMTLVWASVFCQMPGNEDNQINYEATRASLQFTETAMSIKPVTTLAPTPTWTTAPVLPTSTTSQTGSISGKLSYPSEWIPAQRIVAYRLGFDDYYFVETIEEQSSYQISGLPAGTYQVVSYLIGGELSAGYTQAVLCGLSVDCTDHNLIDVQVTGGTNTNNVDPVDWYAPPENFPPDPFAAPPAPEVPALNVGSISGILSYPSEGIPPLQVVAFHQDSPAFYSVETATNQVNYVIENIPSGIYTVVAYVKGENYSGGYTQAVLCGLTAECNDHSLVPVSVDPGITTAGINIIDWYAPEGSFPPNPLR